MGALLTTFKNSIRNNNAKGLSVCLACFSALMLTIGCFGPWLNIDFCLDKDKKGNLDKGTQEKCDAQKTQDVFSGSYTQ